MSFQLDANTLVQALGAFLNSFAPYFQVFLGLMVAAGILHRGMGLIKWAGRGSK